MEMMNRWRCLSSPFYREKGTSLTPTSSSLFVSEEEKGKTVNNQLSSLDWRLFSAFVRKKKTKKWNSIFFSLDLLVWLFWKARQITIFSGNEPTAAGECRVMSRSSDLSERASGSRMRKLELSQKSLNRLRRILNPLLLLVVCRPSALLLYSRVLLTTDGVCLCVELLLSPIPVCAGYTL